MRFRIRPLRGALLFLAVAVAAVATVAFAAGNTMPAGDGKLGDGSQTISGFTITNITYTLNGANPKNLDLVKYTAAPVPTAGATKKIRLVAGGATWYTCTDPLSDGNIECVTTAPQATVLASDELTIIIAQ